MTTKEIAMKNYKRGLWSVEMVARLVAKGKITSVAYKEITGEDYPSEQEVSDSEALAELLEVLA